MTSELFPKIPPQGPRLVGELLHEYMLPKLYDEGQTTSYVSAVLASAGIVISSEELAVPNTEEVHPWIVAESCNDPVLLALLVQKDKIMSLDLIRGEMSSDAKMDALKAAPLLNEIIQRRYEQLGIDQIDANATDYKE